MTGRRSVILLIGRRPSSGELDAVAPTSTSSARRLVGLFDATVQPAADVVEVHSLLVAAEGQGPRFRRELRGTRGVERLWIYASADRWLRRHLFAGHEVIGLDDHGRQVAARLTGAAARSRRLRAIARPRRQAEESAKSFLRWSAGAPSGGRARRWITRRVTAQLLRLAGSQRGRADVLGDLTAAELGAGLAPTRLIETAAAELAIADAHLVAGRLTEAARGCDEALHLLYHRAVQFDRLDSPLPRDPATFTRPLRMSATARRLAAPRGRSTPPRPGRPRSVTLATHGNTNFIGPVARRLTAADPQLPLTELDLSADPAIRRLVGDRSALIRMLIDPSPAARSVVETTLRPHLDQADVIFADWCTAFAVLVTAIDPGRTRIIVRLHSYEALSWWPQLVDFSRVDDVVFVSTHLRDLAVEAIPSLQAARTRRHVIPIGVDTARFARPKGAEARFTLGLIGYGQIAKDPGWALEVLTRLRSVDRRFRLLLIGTDLRVATSAAARDYVARFERQLAPLEAIGAVERLGHTDDVAGLLPRIGLILSSSVRESYHLGLIEGAASGAVPVVRNWPMFAARATGARSLYPAPWVVDSVDEAVDRIRTATVTERAWREQGADAAATAAERFDSTRTDPQLDALFFGTELGVPKNDSDENRR